MGIGGRGLWYLLQCQSLTSPLHWVHPLVCGTDGDGGEGDNGGGDNVRAWCQLYTEYIHWYVVWVGMGGRGQWCWWQCQSPTPALYRVHPLVCGGDGDVMMVVTMLEHNTSFTQSTSTGMQLGWGWGEGGNGVGDNGEQSEPNTSFLQSTSMGVWWGWGCSDVDDSVRAWHQLYTQYIHCYVVGMEE